MSESLLEQLPGIVAAGRRHAARVLAQVEGGGRVALRTRELVIPPGSRDAARPAGAGTGVASAGIKPDRPELVTPPLTGMSSELNRLICGDNLLAVAALLAGDDDSPSLRGKVDLIYIDPPFGSKADYRATVTLPGATLEQRPAVLERFAYSDTWSNGTASYLAMITPRLALMRELLSGTGSIYVHLDWHVGHYVKLVMDELFGSANFVNEVVWRYGKMSNATRRYPQNHDVLLYYAKGPGYFFAPVRAADSEYKARYARFVVADKVHYGAVRNSTDRLILLRVRKVENELGRPLADDDVLFDFTKEFKTQDDVFTDISIIKGNAAENLQFDTQKPEKLVRRLVEASSPPGGLVADFFAGSGTTAAAAERLGRRWIAGDLSELAITVTRRRLIELGAAPFRSQTVSGSPPELARARHGRPVRPSQLTRAALTLFGAQPLNPCHRAGSSDGPTGGTETDGQVEQPDGPSTAVRTRDGTQDDRGSSPPPAAALLPVRAGVGGSFGQLPGTHTLVFADRPAQVTTVATLRRAQRYRERGGFDKVVVLGWSFPPDIGRQVAALADPGLEVLAIPSDLPVPPGRPAAGGSDDRVAGRVRFSGFGFLQAEVVSRKEVDSPGRPGEELRVELGGYVLLSPGATGLDERNRAALRQIMDVEPLALIEYWAVDPDYDGEVFRSAWQGHRSTGAGPATEHGPRVSTAAHLVLPVKDGSRRVCVRAVDVFGVESEAVVEGVEPDR